MKRYDSDDSDNEVKAPRKMESYRPKKSGTSSEEK